MERKESSGRHCRSKPPLTTHTRAITERLMLKLHLFTWSEQPASQEKLAEHPDISAARPEPLGSPTGEEKLGWERGRKPPAFAGDTLPVLGSDTGNSFASNSSDLRKRALCHPFF